MSFSFFNSSSNSSSDISQMKILNKLRRYLETRYPEFPSVKKFVKPFKTEGHCSGFAAVFLYCAWLSLQASRNDLYGRPAPRDDLAWFSKTLYNIRSLNLKQFPETSWLTLNRLVLLTPSFFLSKAEYDLIIDLINLAKLNSDDQRALQIVQSGMKSVDLIEEDRQRIDNLMKKLTLEPQSSQPKLAEILDRVKKTNNRISLTQQDQKEIAGIHALLFPNQNDNNSNDFQKLERIISFFQDIDHFTSLIVYFQNVADYAHSSQGDLHESLQDTRNRRFLQEYVLAGFFAKEDLTKDILINGVITTPLRLLSPLGRPVLISGCDHDIGLIRIGDGTILFYDANEENGPKEFKNNELDAAKAVYKALEIDSSLAVTPLAFRIVSADVNEENKTNYPSIGELLTAIFPQQALDSRHIELVYQKTLETGARNQVNYTILHLAAETNSFASAAFFLRKLGPDNQLIDSKREDSSTALHIASQDGHYGLVRLFLQYGADPNQTLDGGASSLYIASQNGLFEIIKLLLQFKGNPNQARNDGATPIFIAAREGHLEIVKLLLQSGGDPNQARNDGATPLFIAAREGHFKIVELLLQFGGDPHQARNDNTTPLFIAAGYGHLEIVKLLLQSDGAPNQAQDDTKQWGPQSKKPRI